MIRVVGANEQVALFRRGGGGGLPRDSPRREQRARAGGKSRTEHGSAADGVVTRHERRSSYLTRTATASLV